MPVSPLVPASRAWGWMNAEHLTLQTLGSSILSPRPPLSARPPGSTVAHELLLLLPVVPPAVSMPGVGPWSALDRLNSRTGPLGVQGCNCHWDNCVWQPEPLRTALPASSQQCPISSTPGDPCAPWPEAFLNFLHGSDFVNLSWGGKQSLWWEAIRHPGCTGLF